MKKFTEHRYSRVYKLKKRTIIIRVASPNYVKYLWHRMRGHFARRRGDSYEYNGIDNI